tara:strand:+ start:266 stop:511 length:246 start_codon:yes stop_codon:yes gene_type:complete
MRITKEQLKKIIIEELANLKELETAIPSANPSLDDPLSPVHELAQSVQPGAAQMLLKWLVGDKKDPDALVAMLTDIANRED